MFPHLRALAAFVTEAKFAFGKHFAFAKNGARRALCAHKFSPLLQQFCKISP